MWGRGPIGNYGTCSTLCWFSVTPSTAHIQIGPFWCCFLSGWVCVHSRTLWVSLMNSPMRLGVSPAATSTPKGVFNQRFEALFPCAGALGCTLCFAPSPVLLVYLCANVGLQGLPATTLWGLLAAAWSAPFHNPPTSLGLPAAALLGVLSTRLPVSAPPTSLDECFFFISLVVGLPHRLIFCQFWFFVFFLNWCYPSFGCARRHSVPTYASIFAGTFYQS